MWNSNCCKLSNKLDNKDLLLLYSHFSSTKWHQHLCSNDCYEWTLPIIQLIGQLTCNWQAGLDPAELSHCTYDRGQRSRQQQIRLSSSSAEPATSHMAPPPTSEIIPTPLSSYWESLTYITIDWISKTDRNNLLIIQYKLLLSDDSSWSS